MRALRGELCIVLFTRACIELFVRGSTCVSCANPQTNRLAGLNETRASQIHASRMMLDGNLCVEMDEAGVFVLCRFWIHAVRVRRVCRRA